MRTASTTRTSTRDSSPSPRSAPSASPRAAGAAAARSRRRRASSPTTRSSSGVLNDQSGVYKDLSGPNSVKVAVEMAIDDYKAKYGDKAVAKTIEVVTADHQNKPDVANTKAQEMYDRQKADLILDVPTSSAALAVADVAKAKKKLYFNIAAATTALTGKQCNKYTFHYAYDTYMLANGTGTTVDRGGRQELEHRLPRLRLRPGHGEVVHRRGRDGRRHGRPVRSPSPFPSDNFSTFITKARADAKPGRARHDARRRRPDQLRQAVQPVRAQGQGVELAVGLMFITDIHSLGVDQFAGTQFTDAWYWNFDEQNRAWADQFTAKTEHPPVLRPRRELLRRAEYLEAVQAAGTDDADTIVEVARGQEDQRLLPAQRRDPRRGPHVIHDVVPGQVKTKDRGQGGLGLREDHQDDPRRQAFTQRRTAPASCDAEPMTAPSSSTRFKAWRRAASTRSPPSAWPSSSACSASSTSPTAPATCSAPSAPRVLLDEHGLGFWAGAADRAVRVVRVRGAHGAARWSAGCCGSTRSTTSC